MKNFGIIGLLAIIFLFGCNSKGPAYDAAGNFEADEVMVSAQQSGQLLALRVNEGDQLKEGELVGQIDVKLQQIQKEQTLASIGALQKKTNDPTEQINWVRKQIAAQETQLASLEIEKRRFENLVKADAAPRKQLDDVMAQKALLQKQVVVNQEQIKVLQAQSNTKNESVLSEKAPMEKAAEAWQIQVDKGQVINPVSGTVLSKYALKGEIAVTGKPLYKIANTDTLYLRAYISGGQLAAIKLGEQVEVRVYEGKDKVKKYAGKITWISPKSEFTPKNIQTKNETDNLVYALKISVPNDGLLKLGMYGEVFLNPLDNKPKNTGK